MFILFWALQIYLCDYVHVELLLGPCSKNVAAICHRWTRWIKVYNTLKCRQVRSECSKPDFSSFILGNSYTTSKHNGSNHWNNSPYKSWLLFNCEVLYLIVGRHCLKSFSYSYSFQNLKVFISPWAPTQPWTFLCRVLIMIQVGPSCLKANTHDAIIVVHIAFQIHWFVNYLFVFSIITHWEKLLDSDWLSDCEFIRNLRANFLILRQITDLKGKICNSFWKQIQKRIND